MAVVREERTVVEQVIVDVLCDRCGGSCVRERLELTNPQGAPVETPQVERASFIADWGFFSDLDGERWHADLCEGCAAELKQWIGAGAGAGVQVKRLF